MVDQDKELTAEERHEIIEGIKSFGTLSGLIALFLIYTPKRVFGLFGRLAKLLSLKTVIAYTKLKTVLKKNNSKAVKLFSKTAKEIRIIFRRWIKISLLVLLAYSILTIFGLMLESSFLIAIVGVITAIYFLIVCYILEKSIMAIAATYDIGKNLLLDVLHFPKSALESIGINFPLHQKILNEERIRDSFRDLRFASVIVANVSFLLALFPYWSWLGVLAIVGVGTLGISLLHFWNPNWTPTFWIWFRRFSTISLVFLLLIFGAKSIAEQFYPETMKALMRAQNNRDRKFAKEILFPPEPAKPIIVTKIVEKTVIKEATPSLKPKVIAIQVPVVAPEPAKKPADVLLDVKQVEIPQIIIQKDDNSFADRLREAALEAQKIKQGIIVQNLSDNDDGSDHGKKIDDKPKKNKVKVVFTEKHFVLNQNIRPRVIPIPR